VALQRRTHKNNKPKPNNMLKIELPIDRKRLLEACERTLKRIPELRERHKKAYIMANRIERYTRRWFRKIPLGLETFEKAERRLNRCFESQIDLEGIESMAESNRQHANTILQLLKMSMQVSHGECVPVGLSCDITPQNLLWENQDYMKWLEDITELEKKALEIDLLSGTSPAPQTED
jgi:predicted component of viral defense system (DUF524 family)